jgi:hypothetical protein
VSFEEEFPRQMEPGDHEQMGEVFYPVKSLNIPFIDDEAGNEVLPVIEPDILHGICYVSYGTDDEIFHCFRGPVSLLCCSQA